jgi:hypothetical protein
VARKNKKRISLDDIEQHQFIRVEREKKMIVGGGQGSDSQWDVSYRRQRAKLAANPWRYFSSPVDSAPNSFILSLSLSLFFYKIEIDRMVGYTISTVFYFLKNLKKKKK